MSDAHDRELRFLIDRRRFLGLTGGAAAAAFLASCGLSGDSERSPTPSTAGSPRRVRSRPWAAMLNLYTWEGYDTAGDLKSWLKKNDITVNVKYIAGPGGGRRRSSRAPAATSGTSRTATTWCSSTTWTSA